MLVSLSVDLLVVGCILCLNLLMVFDGSYIVCLQGVNSGCGFRFHFWFRTRDPCPVETLFHSSSVCIQLGIRWALNFISPFRMSGKSRFRYKR